VCWTCDQEVVGSIPGSGRSCVTTMGKSLTPACLDADSLRYYMESLNRVPLPFHVAKGWRPLYRDYVVAVPVARHWSVRPTLTVARLPITATSADASFYPQKKKFWRELTS